MEQPEHNPGEPEFGEHEDDAQHNPGEPTFDDAEEADDLDELEEIEEGEAPLGAEEASEDQA